MSEAGAIAASWQRDPRPDTCGQPFPGVEVRLDEDGECLVRSAGVMRAYFRDDAATTEAITPDGFFRTGDVARWTDDGDLQLIERKKDIIITAGGKNVSPSAIEHLLTSGPLVANAIVVGNGRKYLVALLVLDAAATAAQLCLPDADMATLIDDPVVAKAVDAVVTTVNEELSRPEQIKRWAFLERPLGPTDPEMTPTMKVKRKEFEARHRELIESLYE
jgi:long-chain acyl-CoA synthetase